MSCPWHQHLFFLPSNLKPWLAWLWSLALLNHLFAPSHCLHVPLSGADGRPRAALVSLAHQHDLSAIISSVRQLEDRFNGRYRYDWVFFSVLPLSEVKQLTSNATSAVCLFEIVSGETWNTRAASPQSPAAVALQHEASAHLSTKSLGRPRIMNGQDAVLMQQASAWNSDPFSKEHRLKNDWFWRFEPGAKCPHDVHFDLFRYMRDRDVACGCIQASLHDMAPCDLTPPVETIIYQHTRTLQADADISWLPETVGPAAFDKIAHKTHHSRHTSKLHAIQVLRKIIHGGSGYRAGHSWADEGDQGNANLGNVENETVPPSNSFVSWLPRSIHGADSSPEPVMGLLAYFHSPGHQALMDHVEGSEDLLYSPPVAMSFDSINSKVLLVRRGMSYLIGVAVQVPSQPMGPEATAELQVDLDEEEKEEVVLVVVVEEKGEEKEGEEEEDEEEKADMAQSSKADPRREVVVHLMANIFSLWDDMARDLGRQDSIPGLQSGNTVIDDRNFRLMSCQMAEEEIGSRHAKI